MEHFNELTADEDERLALLMEECAEVIQVVGKIMRHGYERYHPNGGPSNRELLFLECGDVLHALHRMCSCGDMKWQGTEMLWHDLEDAADRKAQRVEKYLHHQNDDTVRAAAEGE